MSEPIFFPKKLELGDDRKEKNLSKVVCSNNMLVAVSGSSLLRWNLNDTRGKVDEIEISHQREDRVENIFLDPTGMHLLISMSDGVNFYLHGKKQVPRKVSGLDGTVESIAFDMENSSENSTKSFLAGTSQGSIYEWMIDSSGKEKTCQLVYNVGKSGQGSPMPVTSLHFCVIKTSGGGIETDGASGPRIFVAAATTSPLRLYNFIGYGNFEQIFSRYTDMTSQASPYTELPGDCDRAELHVFSFGAQAHTDMFCLGTNQGIYYGTFRIGGTSDPHDQDVLQAKLMPYDISLREEPPLCIVPTEYHFLALGFDRLQAMSRLSGALMEEEMLRVMDGSPVGLARDPVRGSLWYYSDLHVFQVETKNEDRHLWKIYLERAASGDETMFDAAYSQCRNPEHRATVTRARAEFLLAKGDLSRAATYFGRSDAASFEDVVLRLLSNVNNLHSSSSSSTVADSGDEKTRNVKYLSSAGYVSPNSALRLATTDGPELSALRIYLLEKLRTLSPSAKSQRTMICTWLCEIFLHQISMAHLNAKWATKTEPMLEDNESFPTPVSVSSRKQVSKNEGRGPFKKLEDDLTTSFKEFLADQGPYLEKATTMAVIASRSQSCNKNILLYYAQLIEDYDCVVGHYIAKENFVDALEILRNAPLEKTEQLLYKCAPILMENEPEKAVEVFLKKGRREGWDKIQISKLLPALLRYESFYSSDALEQHNFALQFLQEVLTEFKQGMQVCEPALYHTFAWFLCKYDNSKDETELCDFLGYLIESRKDELLPEGLRLQYIMNQCMRYKRKRAMVYAYQLLDDDKKAVEAALELDIELAKQVVQSCFNADKKTDLWLTIATHVVNEDVDAKRALSLIKESDGYLKIGDLLPILPDFTEIDLFKEEICSTLEASESQIEDLKTNMICLSETAEGITNELDSMKKRGFSVSSIQRCEYCIKPLFSRQFYLFPCSHGFHTDCLVKRCHSHQHLDAEQLATVKSLEVEIQELSTSMGNKGVSSRLEYLQNELDSYVAADCPLCGYVMIRSLDIPLIGEGDVAEAQSWALD